MTNKSKLKVDFFLAGFPKCGTTSLAKYLSDHPNICFSSVKEPMFFCTDFPKRRVSNNWSEYRSLFRLNEQSNILGEGTVIYVYSEVALTNILKHNENAKLIFSIRNPVDLVHSLHSNQLRVLDENVNSLEDAWSLQQRRKRGECIPKSCREPFFLQYRDVALQGKYLKRVFQLFPKKQVYVTVFDELLREPEITYRKILSFLGVEFRSVPEFATYNANTAFKSGIYGSLGKSLLLLTRSPTLIRLKQVVDVGELGIHRIIDRFFMQREDRKPLSPDFRDYLTKEFEDDISLLSDLTTRDLSSWLKRS